MGKQEAAPTLIYLHIPKCAGSTMMQVLRANYGDGFYRVQNGGGWRKFGKLPQSKRSAITCLTGHAPWGLHEHLAQPYRYAVMLRDPVGRVASLYWFCRHFQAHRWHTYAMRCTLAQFAVGRAFADLDNGITRWLAGRADVGSLKIEQPLTDEDMRIATEHLRMASVGFVRTFKQSVRNWSCEFGWQHTKAQRKQTLNYPGLTKAERRVIAEYNRYDVALYEWARGIV